VEIVYFTKRILPEQYIKYPRLLTEWATPHNVIKHVQFQQCHHRLTECVKASGANKLGV